MDGSFGRSSGSLRDGWWLIGDSEWLILGWVRWLNERRLVDHWEKWMAHFGMGVGSIRVDEVAHY